jgi:2-polyprenyl-3-methyl-5-hydroxy-6-metoxy-1,4-benzoquinol methylase
MFTPFSFFSKRDQELKKYTEMFSIKYNIEVNDCLCDRGEADDVVLSIDDVLGIPIRFLMCNKCTIIRPEKRLINDNLKRFYEEDYVGHYINSAKMSEERFGVLTNKHSRSRRFFDLTNHFNLSGVNNIFEIGCGAGQNLWPFFQDGKKVAGCDYGDEYIDFGRRKGMRGLYSGELDKCITKTAEHDLLILSHIVEHVPSPLAFIEDAVGIVRDGGYVLIEVPGVLNGKKSVLQTTFQLPHLYTYSKETMEDVIIKTGLELISIDEEVTVLARRPEGWMKKNVEFTGSNSNSNHKKIIRALKRRYITRRLRNKLKVLLRGLLSRK